MKQTPSLPNPDPFNDATREKQIPFRKAFSFQTTTLIGLAMSAARAFMYALTPKMALFLITIILFPGAAGAEQLRVMKKGLGSGTVTSSPGGINCGTDCVENYGSGSVIILTATPEPDSVFAGWELDGTGTTTRTVTMSADRSVRAAFNLINAIPPLTTFTPRDIQDYLDLPSASHVNTAARFLAALPPEFKQNWLLMSRSESLQTGTAESPRLLLPSADAQAVFTIGMKEHLSYPGSHPNAIEYMQWNAVEKNFQFHEIVLSPIPDMGENFSDGGWSIPARTRGVKPDDAKCFKCHSTSNVLNPGPYPGTTGIPSGTVKWKNKPNWDSYDSWAGLLGFNRDRIYQGSVEAAAFRKFFNLWTWRANDPVRAIIEQLDLQPPGVPAADAITRRSGGPNDGHIDFAFDGGLVLTEPLPSGSSSINTDYSFDGVPVTVNPLDGPSVTRGGSYVTLRHTSDTTSTAESAVEGRAVQFFDFLGGQGGFLNQQRITDELISHRFATGSFPIDVRPIALAIAQGWIVKSGGTVVSTVGPALNSGAFPFFNARHGLLNLTPPVITALVNDTRTRAQSMPHRKADRQKKNLDRTGDEYLASPEQGLIQQYGAATSAGADPTIDMLRQEVFRRPITLGTPDTGGILGGIYVDRELYAENTERIALFRYFLEPLGVSVDKWSMGVRGRSRTYTFSTFDAYHLDQIIADMTNSLGPMTPAEVITAVNNTLSSLPDVNQVPYFTDVQRIFNKSCIECHGGLLYPPYRNYLPASIARDAHLDLSEDENPPSTIGVSPRLARSYGKAVAYTTTDPATSYLYQRLIATSEDCPSGLMPCGGPALTTADIETIRRWIQGPPARPFTVGDTHIRTVDGTNYDFQAAGEFVLLRDEFLELQSRQTAVGTDGPLGPNPHTGLTTCVSVNTAVAIRIGSDRISYQPNLSGKPDPTELQLWINGKLTQMTSQAVPLESGGRVIPTSAPGGLQIDAPGGTVIVITPGFWAHYQLWYLSVDVRGVRATMGLMGAISKGNWLPALPDGTLMGPRPASLQKRYDDLYERFGKAWRVTDTTSLFHYAPGTSTATFTIASWPNGVDSQFCIPPPQPGVVNRPPQPRLPLAEAEKACSDVVDPDRRANCVQDVMATGERGFATTYLLADKIGRNAIPKAPGLLSPVDFPTDKLVKPVTFTWNRATDQDGDPISYKLYIWVAGQTPNNNNAGPVLFPGELSIKRQNGLVVIEWAEALAQLESAGSLTGPWETIPNAVSPHLVFPTAKSQFYRLRVFEQISKTVSELASGQLYYWKVIAEDGKGGTVESETRGFQVE